MRRHSPTPCLSLAALGVALTLLVSACGSSQIGPPNGQASFVAHATNAVFFVQWDRSNSSISGSFQYTLTATPAGDGTTAESEPFTGTISGNGLTINVTPSGGDAATYVGKVSSTGFSLSYPGAQTALITLNFSEAGASAYDNAVTTLADSEYTAPCTIYVQGHNARLTISGSNAASDCATFVSDYTNQDGDAPWTTHPLSDPGDLTDVCSLTDASGEDTAVVEDDGGQDYGGQACQVLEGEGWSAQG